MRLSSDLAASAISRQYAAYFLQSPEVDTTRAPKIAAKTISRLVVLKTAAQIKKRDPDPGGSNPRGSGPPCLSRRNRLASPCDKRRSRRPSRQHFDDTRRRTAFIFRLAADPPTDVRHGGDCHQCHWGRLSTPSIGDFVGLARRLASVAASSHALAMSRNISRSRSDRAVLAQLKHSSAFSRYSRSADTIQPPCSFDRKIK
jgi:hypothetical protein